MDFFKNSLILVVSSTFFIGCDNEKVNQPVATESPTNIESLVQDFPTEQVTYKVGIISNFEPYAFRGDERGLTGFNIDLTNAVAAAEGFKIQYLEKTASQALTSVQSDKVDFIGSIITVTPERDEIIDYSDSYITYSIDAAVKPELKNYSFQQLLSDNSLKYGAMANTRFVDYAVNNGVEKNMLMTSPSNMVSISNVFNGNVDVALTDGQNLKYLKKQYPNINIVENPNDTAEYAYVVKTGNVEMQQILNSGIRKIRQNGEYDKVYNKWFGK